MYFLGVGLILLVMKFMGVSPVDSWSWWIVLAPFGLAVAWWSWADKSGYTKRKAMEVENDRVKARKDRTREALGTVNNKRPR
jgi:small Trp-rich protein